MVKCPYCGEEMILDEVCDDKNHYECPACGYVHTTKGNK